MRHFPLSLRAHVRSSRQCHMRAVALIIASLATLATAADAQRARTSLAINVADLGTGSAIASADVSVPELHRQARTDSAGEARLGDLPTGSYEVRVRRIGYAAAAVLIDLRSYTAHVTILLKPSAAALDTIHVVASAVTVERQKLFEQRRKRGLGRFIGPEVLEKQSFEEFPVVAIEHFPGLALITGRGGQWQLASRHGSCGVDTTYETLSSSGLVMRGEAQGSRVIGAGSGARQTVAEAATSQSSCFSDHPCHVKLFLDDQPVAETDINIVHTSELYGVEYYSTGNAPPKYQVSGAACGIILLWTKAGNSG